MVCKFSSQKLAVGITQLIFKTIMILLTRCIVTFNIMRILKGSEYFQTPEFSDNVCQDEKGNRE